MPYGQKGDQQIYFILCANIKLNYYSTRITQIGQIYTEKASVKIPIIRVICVLKENGFFPFLCESLCLCGSV